ncbi:MAG: bifunctional nuclease domain-containing protein [Candidatus Binatia bacterium]
MAVDPTSRSPVLLLEDPERHIAVPIWIGPAEAQSIASYLSGATPPRPLTHDLMKATLERLGVGLRRVVIRELREHTYLADIVLVQDGQEITIDSRPSDAIALAVRFGQPIQMARELFASEAVVDLRGAPVDTATIAGLTVQMLSADLARYFELPPGKGVIVSDVAEGGPEDVHRGDVILEVNGASVRDPADFRAKLGAAGQRAAVTLQREGARVELDLEVPRSVE